MAFGSQTPPSHVVGIGASAGGPRSDRTLLRQPAQGDGTGVRHRPAPVARLQEHDGRAPGAAHRAADPPGGERDAGRGGARLSDPAEEGDDHLRRPLAPERAGAASGADAADRHLLPVAGAGLRSARGRGRSLRRRQRRVARDPRRPRGRRAGDRPGRRERAVRRDAADGGRLGRRATGCCALRDAAGPHGARGGPLRGGEAGARPASRRPATRP